MPRETMMAWDEARKSREADPSNKALIDAEYNAERAHFEAVRGGATWKRRLLTVIIIFAVAAAAWQVREIVQETQANTAQVHNLTRSLQSAVIESCEENGNARAEVLREQLHEEVEEARHPNPKAFHALVEAGVHPAAIRAIEKEQIVTLDDRLAKIKIANCAKQYHISPGSGNRRRDQQ